MHISDYVSLGNLLMYWLQSLFYGKMNPLPLFTWCNGFSITPSGEWIRALGFITPYAVSRFGRKAGNGVI